LIIHKKLLQDDAIMFDPIAALIRLADLLTLTCAYPLADLGFSFAPILPGHW